MKNAKRSKYVVPAGGRLVLGQFTEFFYCVRSSAEFHIELENGDVLPCWSGVSYRPNEGFKNVTVVNESEGVPLTIEWVWGFGEFNDNSFKVSRTLTVEQETYGTLNCEEITTPATVSISAETREVLIQNIGTADVRIGGTAGVKVPSDGSFRLNFVGDLEISGESTVVVARLS